MTDDPTPFDLDLESAYRQALRAVEAADLPGTERWDAGEETDEGSADVLPFPSAAEPKKPVSTPRRRAEALPAATVDASPRVTPRQILEAALFVGGVELTAAKLASILKGEYTAEFVDRTLDELNRRYEAENRPYEIRRDEGLYRLALRGEHEALRRRVFGLGPKEVRLSQEALEILSLVAYRQPITRPAIESVREGNAGNVLRQLVRRQLVAIERGGESDEVRYVTTGRFLEVFGVASLDELPRAEDLSFK